MNVIRRYLQINEGGQIHARLAIRREPHHFPLIAVRLKAEIFGEAAVKTSHGVWKWDRQHVPEFVVASVPDG